MDKVEINMRIEDLERQIFMMNMENDFLTIKQNQILDSLREEKNELKQMLKRMEEEENGNN